VRNGVGPPLCQRDPCRTRAYNPVPKFPGDATPRAAGNEGAAGLAIRLRGAYSADSVAVGSIPIKSLGPLAYSCSFNATSPAAVIL
jgi:hypothetical protein